MKKKKSEYDTLVKKTGGLVEQAMLAKLEMLYALKEAKNYFDGTDGKYIHPHPSGRPLYWEQFCLDVGLGENQVRQMLRSLKAASLPESIRSKA